MQCNFQAPGLDPQRHSCDNMASYFAKLSSLVSGGYTFPYTLGDAYSTAWGSWTHFEGVHKETGAAVSIFRVSSTNKDEPKMVAARNGVKRLRTVRFMALPCRASTTHGASSAHNIPRRMPACSLCGAHTSCISLS